MDSRIAEYLNLAYRHDVLGDRRVSPERALHDDPEYIAALKDELKRINSITAGNLAQRDFASYQNRRAIEAALQRLGKK